ncbi:MAG: hypothetical protein JWQ96_2081 [Segetibacter sp.]|nr:hypothetical protein [Segetibacter sp.]
MVAEKRIKVFAFVSMPHHIHIMGQAQDAFENTKFSKLHCLEYLAKVVRFKRDFSLKLKLPNEMAMNLMRRKDDAIKRTAGNRKNKI